MPLLNSVSRILTENGIKNKITGTYYIRIEAKKDIERYLKIIRSNNPKHLKRYYSGELAEWSKATVY